jgi:hypothetical protein
LIQISPLHNARLARIACAPLITRCRLRCPLGRRIRRCHGTLQGRAICRRSKEWVARQVKKYDWDIDPDDADHLTIHGLRGTGILARAEQRYEVDQIANDIGMSRQNVEHYMRFRDQMKVGADGQKRLRLVNNEDWTANAGPAIWALQTAAFAKLLALIAKLARKALLNQCLRWGMV